jgi:hypothetical protein
MPKKANVIKIENIPLNNPLEGNDSDNEIELKPMQESSSIPPLGQSPSGSLSRAPTSAPAPKKDRKKINISDEERERRRKSMLLAHEKKMEKARERQEQEAMALKAREDELNQKVLKKADKLRKKQERALLNRIMFDEFTRREDDDEEEDIPAPTPKQKAPVKQKVVQPQKIYQPPLQPVYQPPVIPAFRWV